jgi:nitrite reductase/ring-hydroxylating ferredoxin subunit
MEWVKVFDSLQDARRMMEGKSAQLLIIQGKRICLARHNDSFYAVQDACSHNGESLSKGVVNHQKEIICPWHNYRFDLTTGRACDSSCPDLQTYPLRIETSGFFIGI